MKSNIKTILTSTFILCLICVCMTGLLAVTNELTKDTIAEAAAITEENSRLIVLPTAESFEKINDNSYKGIAGGETVGYVYVTESKGYGGTISVMTGIDKDDNVTGVTILSHNETPGLGSNATNPEFTDQYKQVASEFSVIKGTATTEGQIEALTGSTITTDAVTDAVNLAVSMHEEIKGGV